MFTLPKLPQRLASTIGLGDDAKLAFRTQSSGIHMLSNTRNIPRTSTYWEQVRDCMHTRTKLVDCSMKYITLFDTPSDVFSLITPQDVRRALSDAPENVATLIRFLCLRLFMLVSDHSFPSAATMSFANSIIRSATMTSDRNTTREALNCLRILQRILPVVFERDSRQFEDDLLWQPENNKTESSSVAEHESNVQFVIAEEDEEEDEDKGVSSPRGMSETGRAGATTTTESSSLEDTLAGRLISCCLDLLFCCGFTLPISMQVDHYKINYMIWEKGVGSTIDPGSGHPYDSNRSEVLRMLLVLFSSQIYAPASALLTQPSPWTRYFVQRIHRRHVLTVLCSLLNTALNSSAEVGTLKGLPYNHLVWKGQDPRAILVGLCLQVLCTLLDFQSGDARDIENQDSTAPSSQTNAFRYFMAKLHRIPDFDFILNGTVAIMQEHISATNNMLPGSKRPVMYLSETVVLLWKILDLNKKFRARLFESDRYSELVVYLLCVGLESKDKPEGHGLCRAISYIVQTLSAELSFGPKLSSALKLPIPSKWNTVGTLGDFMITSIYTMVATTSGALNSLYPALIIALSNAGPHFRNIGIPAASRLTQLVTSFANPIFLLADEGNPRLLYFILEALNGILLHNAPINPNVVYAILRAHKIFEDLATFTLGRGLREIRRVQLAKEELRKDPPDRSVEAPHLEKARMLEHEGASEETSGVIGSESRRSEESPAPEGSIGAINSDLTTPPNEPSEKARGKRRAPSLPNLDENEEWTAAQSVGRNGFVPTQAWVTSWQQGLPLDVILLVINELLPKVHEVQASSLGRIHGASVITDFLRSVDLSQTLPVASSLSPRKFLWSDASLVWLSSLIWGEVYVHAYGLSLWTGTNIRLFYIRHTQLAQQRHYSEAVSTVVGGIGGFLRGNASETPLSPRGRR